ncbi:MAG: hypothetical protein KGL35_10975 [Bradyrhizobium sp.]|nr:hypothetical protein [Bradyrhizobium sp.]
MSFNQDKSVFAGMPPAQLQAALTAAQTALIALQTGQLVVTVSYANGSGNRSATYSRTNMGSLVQMIGELKACLGLASRARRGLRFGF